MNEENLTVLRVSKDIGSQKITGKLKEGKRREKGKGRSKERNKEEEGREGGLEKKGW